MFCRLLVYPMAAWILASPCFAQSPAETPKNAPPVSTAASSGEALAAFRRLQNYLKSNPLDFETTFVARADGDELYHGSIHLLTRQPNSLWADVSFGATSYLLVSDGTVLTIYNKQQRKFSQSAAPASLNAAFGYFSGEVGIDGQLLNFLSVVDETSAGSDDFKLVAAGSETIGGRQCDKFTVTGKMGDNWWDAWLEKSDPPLLCRLVYHNVDGPTQTNEFVWKATPVISQETFVFSPPSGSAKVDIGDLNLATPD
jgi:hypothetical protein